MTRQGRRQGLYRDPDPCRLNLAVGDEVADYAAGPIDGDGKADTLSVLIDGAVDADELAAEC